MSAPPLLRKRGKRGVKRQLVIGSGSQSVSQSTVAVSENGEGQTDSQPSFGRRTNQFFVATDAPASPPPPIRPRPVQPVEQKPVARPPTLPRSTKPLKRSGLLRNPRKTLNLVVTTTSSSSGDAPPSSQGGSTAQLGAQGRRTSPSVFSDVSGAATGSPTHPSPSRHRAGATGSGSRWERSQRLGMLLLGDPGSSPPVGIQGRAGTTTQSATSRRSQPQQQGGENGALPFVSWRKTFQPQDAQPKRRRVGDAASSSVTTIGAQTQLQAQTAREYRTDCLTHKRSFSEKMVILNARFFAGLKNGDIVAVTPLPKVKEVSTKASKHVSNSKHWSEKEKKERQSQFETYSGPVLYVRVGEDFSRVNPRARVGWRTLAHGGPSRQRDESGRGQDDAELASRYRSREDNIKLSVCGSIAETFGIQGRSTRVTVRVVTDLQECTLSEAELSFRRQYIGRSDMWRLKQLLHGACIMVGQPIYLSGMRFTVDHLQNNRRISLVDANSPSPPMSGMINRHTKFTFRSRSARVILLIQISSETWDYCDDNERYFEKYIAFLKVLFEQWRQQRVTHKVSFVFFSRTYLKPSSGGPPAPTFVKSMDTVGLDERSYGAASASPPTTPASAAGSLAPRSENNTPPGIPDPAPSTSPIASFSWQPTTAPFRDSPMGRNFNASPLRQSPFFSSSQRQSPTREQNRDDIESGMGRTHSSLNLRRLQTDMAIPVDRSQSPLYQLCPYTGLRYQDHYKVVLDVELTQASWQYDKVLVLLRRELFKFPELLGWGTKKAFDPHHQHQGESSHRHGKASAGKVKQPYYWKKEPASAARGNLLEAVNCAVSIMGKHYLHRDMKRTGQNVIICTAGSGFFTVDRNLALLTRRRMVDGGIGCDLVCVTRPPLHNVPLFLYQQNSAQTASFLKKRAPAQAGDGDVSATDGAGVRDHGREEGSHQIGYSVPSWMQAVFFDHQDMYDSPFGMLRAGRGDKPEVALRDFFHDFRAVSSCRPFDFTGVLQPPSNAGEAAFHLTMPSNSEDSWQHFVHREMYKMALSDHAEEESKQPSAALNFESYDIRRFCGACQPSRLCDEHARLLGSSEHDQVTDSPEPDAGQSDRDASVERREGGFFSSVLRSGKRLLGMRVTPERPYGSVTPAAVSPPGPAALPPPPPSPPASDMPAAPVKPRPGMWGRSKTLGARRHRSGTQSRTMMLMRQKTLAAKREALAVESGDVEKTAASRKMQDIFMPLYMRPTSNLPQRWAHLMPTEVEQKGDLRPLRPNWRAFAMPAILPLTSGFSPTPAELQHRYRKSEYTISVDALIQKFSARRVMWSQAEKFYWLFHLLLELSCQRQAQDFQIIVSHGDTQVGNVFDAGDNYGALLWTMDALSVQHDPASKRRIECQFGLRHQYHVLALDPETFMLQITVYIHRKLQRDQRVGAKRKLHWELEEKLSRMARKDSHHSRKRDSRSRSGKPAPSKLSRSLVRSKSRAEKGSLTPQRSKQNMPTLEAFRSLTPLQSAIDRSHPHPPLSSLSLTSAASSGTQQDQHTAVPRSSSFLVMREGHFDAGTREASTGLESGEQAGARFASESGVWHRRARTGIASRGSTFGMRVSASFAGGLHQKTQAMGDMVAEVPAGDEYTSPYQYMIFSPHTGSFLQAYRVFEVDCALYPWNEADNYMAEQLASSTMITNRELSYTLSVEEPVKREDVPRLVSVRITPDMPFGSSDDSPPQVVVLIVPASIDAPESSGEESKTMRASAPAIFSYSDATDDITAFRFRTLRYAVVPDYDFAVRSYLPHLFAAPPETATERSDETTSASARAPAITSHSGFGKRFAGKLLSPNYLAVSTSPKAGVSAGSNATTSAVANAQEAVAVVVECTPEPRGPSVVSHPAPSELCAPNMRCMCRCHAKRWQQRGRALRKRSAQPLRMDELYDGPELENAKFVGGFEFASVSPRPSPPSVPDAGSDAEARMSPLPAHAVESGSESGAKQDKTAESSSDAEGSSSGADDDGSSASSSGEEDDSIVRVDIFEEDEDGMETSDGEDDSFDGSSDPETSSSSSSSAESSDAGSPPLSPFSKSAVSSVDRAVTDSHGQRMYEAFYRAAGKEDLISYGLADDMQVDSAGMRDGSRRRTSSDEWRRSGRRGFSAVSRSASTGSGGPTMGASGDPQETEGVQEDSLTSEPSAVASAIRAESSPSEAKNGEEDVSRRHLHLQRAATAQPGKKASSRWSAGESKMLRHRLPKSVASRLPYDQSVVGKERRCPHCLCTSGWMNGRGASDWVRSPQFKAQKAQYQFAFMSLYNARSTMLPRLLREGGAGLQKGHLHSRWAAELSVTAHDRFLRTVRQKLCSRFRSFVHDLSRGVDGGAGLRVCIHDALSENDQTGRSEPSFLARALRSFPVYWQEYCRMSLDESVQGKLMQDLSRPGFGIRPVPTKQARLQMYGRTARFDRQHVLRNVMAPGVTCTFDQDYWPEHSYYLEVHWLVAMRGEIEEWVDTLSRKCRENHLKLVPVPASQPTADSDAFYVPIFVPVSNNLVSWCVQRDLLLSLGFVVDHQLEAGWLQYIHKSGLVLVRVMPNYGFVWLNNHIVQEPVYLRRSPDPPASQSVTMSAAAERALDKHISKVVDNELEPDRKFQRGNDKNMLLWEGSALGTIQEAGENLLGSSKRSPVGPDGIQFEIGYDSKCHERYLASVDDTLGSSNELLYREMKRTSGKVRTVSSRSSRRGVSSDVDANSDSGTFDLSNNSDSESSHHRHSPSGRPSGSGSGGKRARSKETSITFTHSSELYNRFMDEINVHEECYTALSELVDDVCEAMMTITEFQGNLGNGSSSILEMLSIDNN